MNFRIYGNPDIQVFNNTVGGNSRVSVIISERINFEATSNGDEM